MGVENLCLPPIGKPNAFLRLKRLKALVLYIELDNVHADTLKNVTQTSS
jgi:hypothetical protein